MNVRGPFPLASREAALHRCDANLAAYVRHAAATAPGGEVGGDDGLVLFAGAQANPTPHLNGVIRLDPKVPVEEVLERACDFFRPKRRGFVLWSRQHADRDIDEVAAARGLAVHNPPEGISGMYADIRFPVLETTGAELRWVTDDQTARDFIRLNGDAWGMGDAPDEVLWKQFLYPQALLDPAVMALLAYVDGRPAACSMAYVADGVPGLYGGATTKWAAGKGLGQMTVSAVQNACFDAGADCAIAQSMPNALRLWVRLGFEVVTCYRRYVVGASGLGR